MALHSSGVKTGLVLSSRSTKSIVRSMPKKTRIAAMGETSCPKEKKIGLTPSADLSSLLSKELGKASVVF